MGKRMSKEDQDQFWALRLKRMSSVVQPTRQPPTEQLALPQVLPPTRSEEKHRFSSKRLLIPTIHFLDLTAASWRRRPSRLVNPQKCEETWSWTFSTLTRKRRRWRTPE